MDPSGSEVQGVLLGSRFDQLVVGLLVLGVMLGVLHVTGIRKMTEIETLVNKLGIPMFKFGRNSIRLLKRCSKPTRKEYTRICLATAIGFAIMGFIGFMVKLIHIPINSIIVS